MRVTLYQATTSSRVTCILVERGYRGRGLAAIALRGAAEREGFTYDRPKGQVNCVMMRDGAPNTRS